MAPPSQPSDEFAPEVLSEQGRQGDHAQQVGSYPLRTPAAKSSLPTPHWPCPASVSAPRLPASFMKAHHWGKVPHPSDAKGNNISQLSRCIGSQLLVPVPHPQLILLAWPPVFPKCWGPIICGDLCLHSCWFILIFITKNRL